MYRIGNKGGTAQCLSGLVGENLKEANKGTMKITIVIVPHILIVRVGEHMLTDSLVDVMVVWGLIGSVLTNVPSVRVNLPMGRNRKSPEGSNTAYCSLITSTPSVSYIVVCIFDQPVLVPISWKPLLRNISPHFWVANLLHSGTTCLYRNRDSLKFWWSKRCIGSFAIRITVRLVRIPRKAAISPMKSSSGVACIDVLILPRLSGEEWTTPSNCRTGSVR